MCLRRPSRENARRRKLGKGESGSATRCKCSLDGARFSLKKERGGAGAPSALKRRVSLWAVVRVERLPRRERLSGLEASRFHPNPQKSPAAWAYGVGPEPPAAGASFPARQVGLSKTAAGWNEPPTQLATRKNAGTGTIGKSTRPGMPPRPAMTQSTEIPPPWGSAKVPPPSGSTHEENPPESPRIAAILCTEPKSVGRGPPPAEVRAGRGSAQANTGGRKSESLPASGRRSHSVWQERERSETTTARNVAQPQAVIRADQL